MSQDFINFVAILKENPDFSNLRINGTTLIYQGKALDLSNFNLTDFFRNNQKFYNDLPSLSIKVIFDVLKIHITLNTQQKVQRFDLNKDYQIVKNSHEATNTSKHVQEEKIIENEAINLISFEEYSSIILNETDLNSIKDNQVKAYESFLFDVITYKNYLTFELYQIYQKFLYLVNYLYQIETSTQIMSDAIKRYEDMFDRSEKVELTNSESKVSKLMRMQKDYRMAGYVSIYIYLIAIIVLIGIIISLYLLVK